MTRTPTSARRQQSVLDLAELRELERLTLPLRSRRPDAPAGRGGAGRLGDGLEFADHRAYAPGDDPRLIDWPYYARMDRLTLRLAHEHSETPQTILLDASASMGAQEGAAGRTAFDAARRVAAVAAYLAMGAGEGVELFAFADRLGSRVRAGRDRRRVLAVLHFLASLQPAGRTELSAAATQLGQRRGGGKGFGVLLVVSDLLGCADRLGDALGRLRLLAGDAAVLHVLPAADEALPPGPTLLEDAETGEQLRVGVGAAVAGRYRQAVTEFRGRCRGECARRGVGYVAVGAGASVRELAALLISVVGRPAAMPPTPAQRGGR